LKVRTVQAGIAAAALVLSPAVAGVAAEVAEFSGLGPATYCMVKPQACVVATELAACAVAGSACPAGSLAPQVRTTVAAAPVRKVFVGVEMDPSLPPPAAGWDYFPKVLPRPQTEGQYYSHLTGFQSELNLANDVAKSQTVLKWGDKIGLNGSDIVSVDVNSPAATVFLGDSKYRAAAGTLVQSPTFANSGTREAAVKEAIEIIQSSPTLSAAVKLKAISNLESSPMNEQWFSATRRLWFGIVARTLCASVVVSPTVAAVALLVAKFGIGIPDAFPYIVALLGVVANLLVWLWATRNALQQSYPQGVFRLVPHESALSQEGPPK
jgi:hypothetical protein